MDESSQRPATTENLGPGMVVERRYRIIRELGRGGMGTVYEAEQIHLKKRVALKVMLTDGDARGLKNSKRFLREARIASSIKHRNVVDTTDFGDLDERSTYYVMELLQGRDLATLLRAEGPMPWPRVRAILRQVLSGLTAAHDQGIIHRDIKPANIVVLDEPDQWGKEWVKVLDFGIAKIEQADEESQALTGTSEILGTAKYMAPELVRGERPDARTDLYAVGIVAYQLLTGTAPFEEQNTFKLLMQHMKDQPQPPSKRWPQVPAAVDGLVLRALAKDPAARFQSAAQMRQALDELGDSPEPPVGGTQVAFSGDALGDALAGVPSAPPLAGTQVLAGTEVLAGGTVLAPQARSAPAATPAVAHHAPRPSTPPSSGPVMPSPQLGAVPPLRAPKESGLKAWMVLIPVIAIGAGIAVGWLM